MASGVNATATWNDNRFIDRSDPSPATVHAQSDSSDIGEESARRPAFPRSHLLLQRQQHWLAVFGSRHTGPKEGVIDG
jgi:hypothetical protein